MRKTRWPIFTALAIALASASALAYRVLLPDADPGVELPTAELASPVPAQGPAAERVIAPNLENPYGVTHDQVGDADSFGSPVRWLGVNNAFVAFARSCPRTGAVEGEVCHVLPSSGTVTAFEFRDLAPIELPAGASRSLLCHWLTPIVQISYRNNLSTRTYGQLAYTPSFTFRSPVLDDPGLINPKTGRPYGGQLVMPATTQWLAAPLEPGVAYTVRTRDAQVCIGAPLNRRTLIESYGMAPELADRIFQEPIKVSLGVSGTIQLAEFAYMTLGYRLVGD